jgi:hypothetical protein
VLGVELNGAGVGRAGQPGTPRTATFFEALVRALLDTSRRWHPGRHRYESFRHPLVGPEAHEDFAVGGGGHVSHSGRFLSAQRDECHDARSLSGRSE